MIKRLINELSDIRSYMQTAVKDIASRKARMLDRMDNAIKLLKEQKTEWISVDNRLPKLNQEVLVYAVAKTGHIPKHTIEKCHRYIRRLFPSSPGEEIWSSPFEYFSICYEVTHWMELPQSPDDESA